MATTITARDPVVTGAGNTTAVNAVELLKADHRQVEEWFHRFNATGDVASKEALAAAICKALEVHMRIEEEIFFPAFLAATGDDALHHRAIAEHQAVRDLIGRIRSSPGARTDGYFDARVQVLAVMIQHHVHEEEQPGGMFDAAIRSGMNPDALGARLEQRKIQLMNSGDTDRGYDAAVARPDTPKA